MAARFWVGGTGTWDASSTTNWSATTGGAGGASVPTSADTVTIDASSGSGTITVNTNFTITTLTCGAMNMTLDFSANNNTPTITNSFTISGTGTRTLNMGNGVWTFSGLTFTIGTITNLTINQGASSILFTNTSNSTLTLATTNYPLYWNKFTFSRGASTGTISIGNAGNNGGVETLIDLGTAAHSILFQAVRTTVVNNMIVRGTAGNLITIGSTTTNTAGLTKSSLGIVTFDYVTINNITVAQTNMWYAGANSTAVGTTTNWIITDPPARKLVASGVG